MTKHICVWFILVLLLLLILMPLVHADDDDEDEGFIGALQDLPSKIFGKFKELPEIFFEYFLSLINEALQPLLDFLKRMLTEPVNISVFKDIWKIMNFIISIFYGIMILYSGLKFMTSGHDPGKRTQAKETLKNAILVIILVQLSYFLYYVTVQIGAGLSNGVVSLIPASFFLFTSQNSANFGMELIFSLHFLIVLFVTILMLIFRHVMVTAGVALFPIGILLCFTEVTRPYGKLIINFLMSCIFVTFIAAIILLVFSQLYTLEIYQNYRILLAIAAFVSIDLLMFFVMFFAILKSAFKVVSKVASVARFAAAFL